jgi:hypothetical protein
MRSLFLLPVLLLAMLSAPVARAETRQHGNLIFDIPTGWTPGAISPDGTLTLLSDLPDDACEFCYVYLSSGAAGASRPDAWLATQSARFVEKDEIDPPVVEPLSPPEVFNLKGRPAAMMAQKVDGNVQMLFAVQLFGRMELIGFEMPAYDDDDFAANMPVFERDVMPMIEAARFVSEGATPLMPPPQPGGRQGVYWGTSTYWTLGLDMMMQMQISHHWLTFWPDGTFYDGTPPNGIAPFAPADLLARADMSWGTYREDGGRLVLSYASGEVAEWQVSEDGFEQDSTYIYPVEVLANGTAINGSVSTFFYSGFSPGSGISGGVSSSSLTEFHPDGTWSRGSSGGAFGSFDTGGGFATSSEGGEGGRYEVKDGLVIQYAADGSVYARNIIFKVDADIWIGSEALAYGP